MSTHKTKIDQEAVASFLNGHFDDACTDLAFIAGGESSQAFGFSTKGQDYIIRVNKENGSFKKDKFAHNRFASPDLPIPRVLEIGPLENYFFAISERVAGVLVQELPQDQYMQALPALLAVLESIHSADISWTHAYGKWNADGEGEYASWKEFILSGKRWVTAAPGEKTIFETTFLEQEVWEKIYNRIMQLAEFCPEERRLIHGDYGYDNVLSDGEKITGVIDWGEAKYGDSLYDIAWMNFWAKSHSPIGDFAKLFRDRNLEKGISYPNFEERVRCYELHAGLGALSFYAFSIQKDKYDFAKERLLSLV